MSHRHIDMHVGVWADVHADMCTDIGIDVFSAELRVVKEATSPAKAMSNELAKSSFVVVLWWWWISPSITSCADCHARMAIGTAWLST